MWLVATQGFYSVVAHRRHPDRVIVRARAREDLEALRDQIPGLRVFSDPHADYRWRAVVTRAECGGDRLARNADPLRQLQERGGSSPGDQARASLFPGVGGAQVAPG